MKPFCSFKKSLMLMIRYRERWRISSRKNPRSTNTWSRYSDNIIFLMITSFLKRTEITPSSPYCSLTNIHVFYVQFIYFSQQDASNFRPIIEYICSIPTQSSYALKIVRDCDLPWTSKPVANQLKTSRWSNEIIQLFKEIRAQWLEVGTTRYNQGTGTFVDSGRPKDFNEHNSTSER